MKISVALCTYNGAQYLNLQLNSIFQQTVSVQEIIICDDGSQDSTISIINSFKALHPGIIQFHQNEHNLGARKNFEKALTLSTGSIIFLSDQDDIWLPHKVAVTLQFFAANPDAAAVFSNGSFIDDEGKTLPYTIWQAMGFSEKLRNDMGVSKLFEFLIRVNNMVTGAALCLKKEACSYILPFFCPGKFWHDYWIALAAAYHNGLYFLEEEVILYRLHNSQQVGLPVLNEGDKQQNDIKEMLWFGKYCQRHTERFIHYNIGARRRLSLFASRLSRLSPNQERIEKLQLVLLAELEILKQHLFAEMTFLGKKKLALIAILGRQKTLNLSRADILKLLLS